MWDVGAANNSQIEDDHFTSVIKIMFSGTWISAFAEMTINLVFQPRSRGRRDTTTPNSRRCEERSDEAIQKTNNQMAMEST